MPSNAEKPVPRILQQQLAIFVNFEEEAAVAPSEERREVTLSHQVPSVDVKVPPVAMKAAVGA